MTAHAHGIVPAAGSPDRQRLARRASRVLAVTCGVRWILACACMLGGHPLIAGQPGIAEDITVPSPSFAGSFESFDGDSQSVVVDDGSGEGDVSTSLRWGSGGAPPIDDGLVPQSFEPTPIAACHDGGAYACEPGDPCRACRSGCLWSIQADALVLWRNNIDGQPLLSGTDGSIALDTGDVRTAAAAGPRIGVVRSLGCGRAIEGNYFNVGGIQGTTVTDGLAAPYTPIGLADIAFTDIDEASYTTRGQIKSAELNYRWCQGRRVTWLAGFRWVEWNEAAAVTMQVAGDDLRSVVGNDLYGGQFGCRLRLWNLGKWQVGTVGKAGVFGNTAYQRTTAVVDGVDFGPIGAASEDVAFFGEVGVNSTLWLTHWLAWRAGYNFFWLEGVATAAQQFPLGNFGADTAAIDVDGGVFLQGFSTGLEARW